MLFWLSDVFSDYAIFRIHSLRSRRCVHRAMIGELKLVTSDAVLSYVRGSAWLRIVPPTTPHPQLCRDANSQCSASTLNQPQYQMQCKPVLFNFWYSNILQMRRRQWAQCETVSFTINYFRYIHQLQHLLAMLWGNVGLGLDTNSGITKPMMWNILQICDFLRGLSHPFTLFSFLWSFETPLLSV